MTDPLKLSDVDRIETMMQAAAVKPVDGWYSCPALTGYRVDHILPESGFDCDKWLAFHRGDETKVGE